MPEIKKNCLLTTLSLVRVRPGEPAIKMADSPVESAIFVFELAWSAMPVDICLLPPPESVLRKFQIFPAKTLFPV